MAGKKDIVEQALKLIAGGVKETGPSVAERAAKNIDVFNTANRLGVDTNDIAKLQETKRLMDYHKGFMGDVRERAQSLAELQRQMQEQGAFPMEVGTRFTTPHSQKFGQPPHIVTGYYVDPKNPSGRYGYRVRQEHGDGSVTEQMLMIRDPKLEALHGPEKWEELQRGFVPMTGPKVVKASGGSIREGYATQGAVQPGQVFMEDAKGNRYDVAGNIIPPEQDPVTDALSVARRETDPYLMVPGHEHLTSVPPTTPPRPEYVPGETISTATQPSRDVFWQGVEQFRTPQTEPRTPERAWELLSGAGQIGLGALGTGISGAIGAGTELLPTWLTGPQNQRNKLASELNEMTMFADPMLGPDALAATAPVQRVGGIRNAAAVEGDLAKQRMAERGPATFYDPLKVASGVDPTEAGKAIANAKDTAIAKVGDVVAPALKAAQEAAGGDDIAAATRAAQLETLNPVEPPKGIPAPEHALGTQRGARTVIAPTSIKLTPAEKAIVDGFQSRADRAIVASRIRETKARYPKSDGWAPFEAVGASFDDKGNPVIKWQEQKYGFNTAMQQGMTTEVDPVTGQKIKVPVVEERALRPGTPEYTRAADKATRNGVKAVEDIIRRAAEGDEAALKIIRQAGWYREFMKKGFDERGGSYPAFSDLLGATSPNTAVDQNYRYSVDLQNRFARGDFDEPVKFASEYTGSLNEFPEEKLIFRDPVGPKGPQKLQYGMNSRNAQMALADKWRTKEPGQAPKARNFSGNLGGATDEATIDVWAARFINRMAGRKRLPPPVESGVKGKLGSNLVPTGEFGYGQDVFRRITDELNRKGNLQPYLRELGYDNLTPMDMQALTWFIEKEHWTKNNWTTAAGEGGSFEDELARYPSERWQSGVSIQQAEPPSDEAMAYTRNVFENSLRDDPNVNQYRVHPTIGRYAGNNERSFDLELTAKPGWNPRTWMAAVIREAQANNQYDVFFSKRLSPSQAKTNPNARPGVEIYFRDRKSLDEALPILEEFTKRNADGFTFVTDLRLRERELGGKEAPDFVGVRMQWVPEIRSRWDDEFRNAVEADPAVLDSAADEALDAMQSALLALDKAGLGIVDARVHHYDTLTVGKESYDKFLEGITDPENAAGAYEGRAGAAVDPVKRFGQPLHSHVEGRNRALRAGDEGGAADTGGDVVGAGEPSGPLTPEERAANLKSTFGQTYLKDPQGNPMRLYHLTPQDITEFSASPKNRAGPVVFLSPYKDFQPAYHQAGVLGPRGEFTQEFREGANVMPVYADVRSPLVLDHPRKIREAAAKYQNGDREFPRYVSPEAKAAMEADGYDAIIFGGDNPIPYGDRPMDARLGHQEARDEEIIVFDPKKIKSAVGNKGTYDLTKGDITKAYGGALVDDEDIDNALRLARATGGRAGYAEAGSVPVMMEDAKGNKYDAQGNVIPPTNPGPNPQRSDVTPEALAAKAVNDPATYDALMERYAVPDRDIAEYEALKQTVSKQPQDIQQMTHVGSKPRREVTVDMPLFGGEYSMGSAPYDTASSMGTMAQTAYDLKTAPLYATPAAPFALAADTAEGVMTGDPLSASLAIGFGPGGKYAKAAGIGAVNYLMAPDQAEAGPERWFSKAMEVARNLPMEKMTGEQALAMLRKGVSPEELRWTGADVFLSTTPKVSKEELLDYLKNNRFQTEDITLGGGKPTRREDVKPTPTASAPYMEEWNRLKAEDEKLNADFDLSDADKSVQGMEDFWKRQFEIDEQKDALRSKMIDATIAEMGGLGLPVQYGPGSRFGDQYVTRGGEEYGEDLYKMPNAMKLYNSYVKQLREKYGEGGLGDFPLTVSERGTLDNLMEAAGDERKVYTSGHFPQYPGYLAHSRSQVLNVEPPGANRPYKAWNVEEAQSDLAKSGRKSGFYDPVVYQKWVNEYYANEKAIEKARDNLTEVSNRVSEAIGPEPKVWRDPAWNEYHIRRQDALDASPEVKSAREDLNYLVARGVELEAAMPNTAAAPIGPFVKSMEGWSKLTVKKQLDKALDSGADYFTWTPGEAQAQRYSLSKVADRITYNPPFVSASGKQYAGRIIASKNGSAVFEKNNVTPDKLPEFIGEELSSKLLNNKEVIESGAFKGLERYSVYGDELKFGGEGMRKYYDSAFVKYVQDVFKEATGKKPNIEVITAQTADGPRQQLGIRLTDEMREKARFSDFNKGGRVSDPVVNKALSLTSG